MLTSSCPGTDETKRMLAETAARVGARFAMLLAPDGELEACAGLDDRWTAECFAQGVALALQGLVQLHASETGVYADFYGPYDSARLYVRVIATGRLVVTGFDYDEGELGTARVGVPSPRGTLAAGAALEWDAELPHADDRARRRHVGGRVAGDQDQIGS